MGVALGCVCKEVYIYIYFLILLIPIALISALFCSNIPTFFSLFLNVFLSCLIM